MTTLTGYAQATGPAPQDYSYGFYNYNPVIPRVDSPTQLPATWPPPGFFDPNPRNQGNFLPAFPAIPETPFKDDVQLDQERQQIQQSRSGLPSTSSLLWIAALSAVAYYVYKKGKS